MSKTLGVRGEDLKSQQGQGVNEMRNTLEVGRQQFNSDEGGRIMSKSLGVRWLVVAAGAAMLLVLGAACGADPEVVEVVKEVEVVRKWRWRKLS